MMMKSGKSRDEDDGSKRRVSDTEAGIRTQERNEELTGGRNIERKDASCHPINIVKARQGTKKRETQVRPSLGTHVYPHMPILYVWPARWTNRPAR